MCENEKWKADHLHKAFPDCKIIFTDMRDLGTGKGYDAITGKRVDVPFAPGLCFQKIFLHCSFLPDFFNPHVPDKSKAIIILGVKAEAVGLVAGYPCRSLSLQNNNPQSFTDKASSTGGGFHSTVKYVERHPELQWVLLENVQGMFHVRKKFGNECPMEIQTKRMKKLGFKEVFALLLNSSDFGLAHSRPRAWVLYIREDHVRSFVLTWYRFQLYHAFF